MPTESSSTESHDSFSSSSANDGALPTLVAHSRPINSRPRNSSRMRQLRRHQQQPHQRHVAKGNRRPSAKRHTTGKHHRRHHQQHPRHPTRRTAVALQPIMEREQDDDDSSIEFAALGPVETELISNAALSYLSQSPRRTLLHKPLIMLVGDVLAFVNEQLAQVGAGSGRRWVTLSMLSMHRVTTAAACMHARTSPVPVARKQTRDIRHAVCTDPNVVQEYTTTGAAATIVESIIERDRRRHALSHAGVHSRTDII